MATDSPLTASSETRHQSSAARVLPWLLALGCYTVLTVVHAWPLLRAMGGGLPSDMGDPALNAWILWWNAHAMPLTAKWWNAPVFYPIDGAFGLSETMLSVAMITSPLQWLGLTAVQAYNVAFVLSIPTAAIAAHALAFRLTKRHDAALIAGLAFGFAPYRVAQWPHLQMLWTCWMPLALLGLHRYISERRVRDLVLFAAAWLLTSLTCGYYMMYFAVLAGLWVCWFARTRREWIAIGIAAIAGALPLAPLLLGYQRVQAGFGLSRGINEIESFGADLTAIWASSSRLVVASHWTMAPKPEGELYPGATILMLAILGAIVTWRRHRLPQSFTRTRLILLALASAAIVLAIYTAAKGGWAIALGPIQFSSHRSYRIASFAFWLTVALVVTDARIAQAWRRSSPFLFYGLATIAMLLFALGPVGRIFGDRFLWKAPYSWLMLLPGGTALRVPARFSMLFVMCLGQTAALAWARLVTRPAWRAVVIIPALAVLADGWAIVAVEPMPRSVDVRALDPSATLLELPITDLYGDTKAMLNATIHGHTLVNGYSGYYPPFYGPLTTALQMSDSRVLDALRQTRPLGIYIDPDRDGDGKVRAFIGALPGITRLSSSTGPLFVLPASRTVPIERALTPVSIAGITTTLNQAAANMLIDGNVRSRWSTEHPQSPGDAIRFDLGAPVDLARVVIEQGIYGNDYPRKLRVEISLDDAAWTTVWEGPPASLLVEGALRDPIGMPIAIDVAGPTQARFIRLTCLTARMDEWWSIAEVKAFTRSR